MWIPITTTLFLYLLMTKPEDSSFICGVFISVRILCTSFINVALYISLFCRYILHAHKVASTLSSSRFILVKFSDRALVYNGHPNLKLLNFLFCVVCVTCVSFSYGVFPLSKQLRGNFLESSIMGTNLYEGGFST